MTSSLEKSSDSIQEKIAQKKDSILQKITRKLFFMLKKEEIEDKDDSSFTPSELNPHFSTTLQKEIGTIQKRGRENYEFNKKEQDKVLSFYESIEDKVLKEYNINKERIIEYIESLGMKMSKNIIFLRKKDIKKIVKNTGLSDNPYITDQDTQASYIFNVDLPFVFVDRIEKNINYNITIESLAIHEILHYNSGVHSSVLIGNQGIPTSMRFGFETKLLSKGERLGNIFEEGFVRRYQALYKKKYGNSEINNIKREFLSDQFFNESEYSKMHEGYLSINKRLDKISYDFGDLSGIVIDMLIEENPELEKLMLGYRQGKTENLGKIIQIIAKYKLKNKKNLYAELRKLQYKRDDFQKSYFLTKEAIDLFKSKHEA